MMRLFADELGPVVGVIISPIVQVSPALTTCVINDHHIVAASIDLKTDEEKNEMGGARIVLPIMIKL
jgi:hypothetical protein